MINKLEENRQLPQEGFFWIIDDKVIGFAEEVPIHDHQYNFQGKTHENTWNLLQHEYKVNGKEVSLDYYPRGRVMVNPNYDKIIILLIIQ